tara:strand:+ start:6519 stop:7031 length:513 start_codon:yes stop_codon:yes gene_type:complete
MSPQEQPIRFNQILINGTPKKFRLYNNYNEFIKQKHIRTTIDNPNTVLPNATYFNYGLYNRWIKCGRNPNKPSELCIGDNTLCNSRIRVPDGDIWSFWSSFKWDKLTAEERKLWETIGFTRELWNDYIFKQDISRESYLLGIPELSPILYNLQQSRTPAMINAATKLGFS